MLSFVGNFKNQKYSAARDFLTGTVGCFVIFYEKRKQKQNVLVICGDADIWGSPSLNATREGKIGDFVVSASLSPSVGHSHSIGEVSFEARLQLVSLTDVL